MKIVAAHAQFQNKCKEKQNEIKKGEGRRRDIERYWGRK